MAIMTGDLQTTETFDPAKASEAQRKYCEANFMPMFAPSNGVCFRCNRNIYSAEVSPGGFVSGISVNYASSHPVTGCPFCHISFCD